MARTIGPAVAGTWYPAEPDRLETEIEALFASPAPDRPGLDTPNDAPVEALIAPHAGLVFSGGVAANVFSRLDRTEVDRVLLMGPSHHAAYPGVALPPAEAYRTPLGDVAFDLDAMATLEGPGFRVDESPFLPEHGLEIELPFLQRRLKGDWKLVPLLFGAGTRSNQLEPVVERLRPLLGPRTLMVVSSDFTHFGMRFNFMPFRKEIPESIERLDLGAVERIAALEIDRYETYLHDTAITICGHAPIGVMMRLLPPGSRGHLTAYATSAQLNDDWNHSVSYASIVFPRVGDSRGSAA